MIQVEVKALHLLMPEVTSCSVRTGLVVDVNRVMLKELAIQGTQSKLVSDSVLMPGVTPCSVTDHE
jgi:hypothetical protein